MMYLSHCPVTGGVPTRMSGAAFARLCEERRGTRRRKLNSVAVVTGSKACEKCKGKRRHWPPELEIIDIETEEPRMGAKTKTSAETELRAKLALAENRIERLAETLGCVKREEAEMEAEAADIAKAARAWAALMDRARDCGFAEIADGDPVVMAGTYIMAVDEVMRERNRLREELAARDEAPAVETLTSEETARNVALLRWARQQLEAGRIGFHIEVREAAA